MIDLPRHTNLTADVRKSVNVSYNVKFKNVTLLKTIKINSQTTKGKEKKKMADLDFLQVCVKQRF